MKTNSFFHLQKLKSFNCTVIGTYTFINIWKKFSPTCTVIRAPRLLKTLEQTQCILTVKGQNNCQNRTLFKLIIRGSNQSF